mmetsp:Transcript_60912/g.104949  ORF Transcript_60912/g.104949 Transcript_60912/m.104949 type:complete len:128 (+) Transcript_60912:571-954(+)
MESHNGFPYSPVASLSSSTSTTNSLSSKGFGLSISSCPRRTLEYSKRLLCDPDIKRRLAFTLPISRKKRIPRKLMAEETPVTLAIILEPMAKMMVETAQTRMDKGAITKVPFTLLLAYTLQSSSDDS